MSRVELQPLNPEHEVVVGLDRPLSTFFITVTVRQAEGDLRDIPPIVFRDRWRRVDVLENIERFAAPSERRERVIEALLDDLDPGDFVPAREPKGHP